MLAVSLAFEAELATKGSALRLMSSARHELGTRIERLQADLIRRKKRRAEIREAIEHAICRRDDAVGQRSVRHQREHDARDVVR